MSLKVLTIVWDRYPEGGSKLLTMLALADWADDDGGRIYPSMATLAAKIRMSERHAIRVMHYLVEKNYLELLTPDNKGGSKRSNRYRIKLTTLRKTAMYNPPIEADPVAANPDKMAGLNNNNPDISAETLTSATINPDIATSDEPLEPLLYNQDEFSESYPKPRTPGERDERIATLAGYLRSIENISPDMVDPREIERAKSELAKLKTAVVQ
jgi:hypothetical protein